MSTKDIKTLMEENYQNLDSIDKDILKVIAATPEGIKARKIAGILETEKKTINSHIYRNLTQFLEQDETYKWSIKDEQFKNALLQFTVPEKQIEEHVESSFENNANIQTKNDDIKNLYYPVILYLYNTPEYKSIYKNIKEHFLVNDSLLLQRTAFKKMIETHFHCECRYFILNERQKIFAEDYLALKKYYEKYKVQYPSYEHILYGLKDEFSQWGPSLKKAALVSLLYEYHEENENDAVYEYCVVFRQIEGEILRIREGFVHDCLTNGVDTTLLDTVQKDILHKLGISDFDSLFSLDDEGLSAIFCLKFDVFRSITDPFVDKSGNMPVRFPYSNTMDFAASDDRLVFDVKHYENELRILFNRIPENRLYVLLNRYCFERDEKPKTLEVIAKTMGITRERVRQIQQSSITQLLSNVFIVEYADQYFKSVCSNTEYISVEDFLSLMNDRKLMCLYLIILANNSSEIVYDDSYHVIYDSELIEIDEVERQFITDHGSIVSIVESERLTYFEKQIIRNHYSLKKNNWILRGQTNSIKSNVLKEIFKDGFSLTNADDYKKYREQYAAKFGYKGEELTDHAIAATIQRSGFILAGRGFYLPEEVMPSIPSILMYKMKKYISKNTPIVYYDSIFEEFKDSLEDHNVTNKYILKSIIDRNISDQFKTKRDYIITGDDSYTAYKAFDDFILTLDRVFSIEDFRKRFPGVKDYVFANYLSTQETLNILYVGNMQYKILTPNRFSRETIQRLKGFIEQQMQYMGSSSISARKLYGRMKFVNKELFAEMQLEFGARELQSICRVVLPEYYYSQIMISKDERITQYDMITNYIYENETITIEEIQRFISKHSLRIGNVSDLIDNISDDYLLINDKKLLRKDCFNISNAEIVKLKNVLALFIRRLKIIDTRFFNGYNLLPKLSYEWNKHLLVSICRTYLDDTYKVTIVNAVTSNMDYTIENEEDSKDD